MRQINLTNIVEQKNSNTKLYEYIHIKFKNMKHETEMIRVLYLGSKGKQEIMVTHAE